MIRSLSILFLFSVLVLNAGNRTDSLKLKLKDAVGDSAKIKIITDLAWLLSEDDQLDEALNYCTVLRNTSERVNNYMGIGNSYIISGNVFEKKDDFVTALSQFNKSLEAFKKGKILRGIDRATEHIARCYSRFGKHEMSRKYYTDMLNVAIAAKDTPTILKVYNNIARTYDDSGNDLEAFNNYQIALKIAEAAGDKRAQFYSYNNMALLFISQKHYKEALDYHLKALKTTIEIQDSLYIGGSYFNIGSLYFEMKDHAKAVEYNNRSIKVFELTHNHEDIGDCYALSAKLHEVNGNYKMAMADYLRADTIFEASDYFPSAIKNNLDIAALLIKQKDLKSAQDRLDRATKIASRANLKAELMQCYLAISNFFESSGKFKEALDYYIKFNGLQDTIQNGSTSEKMLKQQMGFEFEKKEDQLRSENKKTIQRAEEEKRRQNIITISISIGFILVLVLASVIYRGLRQNRHKNKIITEQKKMVEEKQKEILDSIKYARRIQQSLMPTEKYFERNLNKLM